MLTLLVLAFEVVALGLITASGCLALAGSEGRRRDAFRVLRLFILASTGTGGLITAMLELYRLGLIHG